MDLPGRFEQTRVTTSRFLDIMDQRKAASLRVRIPVIVEVLLRQDYIPSVCIGGKNIDEEVTNAVRLYLESKCAVFCDDFIQINSNSDGDICKYVSHLRICGVGYARTISFWQADLQLYCYRCSDSPPETDYLENSDEELPATEQWELPNRHLEGLWESIILDDQIKDQLLGYSSSSLLFSVMFLQSFQRVIRTCWLGL